MKKTNIFLLIIILLVLVVIVLGTYIVKNYNKQQAEYIKIDEYNFGQLEKVKPILESIQKDAKKFYTLKEFNEIYKVNIETIKNCYYVSNSNGSEPYIFGFKLESNKYKKKYLEDYYVYPKYDLPATRQLCTGFKYNTPCEDFNLNNFYATIST